MLCTRARSVSRGGLAAVAASALTLAWPAAAPAKPPVPAPPGATCSFAKGVTTCEVVEQRQVVYPNRIVGGHPTSFVATDCPNPITSPRALFGPYAGYYDLTFLEQRVVVITYRGKRERTRAEGPWTFVEWLSSAFTGRCYAP